MPTENSKRNKSMVVAISAHLVLLLIFFFMLAWTAPDPPIPEYGIELNMSFSNDQSQNDDEPISYEVSDEVTEVNDPIEELEDTDSQPSESVETLEEVVETTEPPIETEDNFSPDVVEKTIEKDQSKETETTRELAKTENELLDGEEKKPIPDQRAIYKKSNSGSGGGAPQGSSLDLSGWIWDEKPQPNDRSSEDGIIVFQIIVDDMGEILSVTTKKKTVSPLVEKIYRDAVMDLTFSPTADNRSVAPQSTGTITFIIKSN